MRLFSTLFLLATLAVSVPANAAPYTVTAISTDTDAVVLTAPDGRLQRLRRGESVPQSAWRLGEVHAGRATFTRMLPDSGTTLAITAARGETLDFAALDQRHADAAQPAATVESHVIVNQARSR